MLLEVSMDETSVSKKNTFHHLTLSSGGTKSLTRGQGDEIKQRVKSLQLSPQASETLLLEKMDTTGNGIIDTKENKLTILVRDSEHTSMVLHRENEKESLPYSYVILYYSYLKLRYMTWTSFFFSLKRNELLIFEFLLHVVCINLKNMSKRDKGFQLKHK